MYQGLLCAKYCTYLTWRSIIERTEGKERKRTPNNKLYHTSLQGSWETRLMWAEMKLLRVEDRGRDMITCMLDLTPVFGLTDLRNKLEH